MKRILFVCSGNVGRSQMAEAFYNFYTKSKNAYSAGTDPSTPLKYAHPAEAIIKVMSEEGIDVSKAIVKTIEEKMVENADAVYVMCRRDQCPDYLSNSEKVVFWEIEDPFNMDIPETRKIRDQIKRKVESIIEGYPE